MTRNRKRIAMLIVVVGSGLIGERVYSLAAGDVEDAVKVVVPKRTQRSAEAGNDAESVSTTPVDLRLDRLDDRQKAFTEAAAGGPSSGPQRGLFDAVPGQAVVAKAVLPPPPPPAPPPPKPVPPPFGYAYMGGLTEDGVRTAFFTQGEKVIAVKAGDTVDAAFRIDTMTEKQMTLTYLPLNETIVLALGTRP